MNDRDPFGREDSSSPRTGLRTWVSNLLHEDVASRPPRPMTDEETMITRRAIVQGAVGVVAAAGLAAGLESLDHQTRSKETSHEPSILERQKALFEKMSKPELAQWILESSDDVATAKKPVRTPQTTPAYIDLKHIAEGKPAYKQTLLRLDGKEIKMAIDINRDILMFRALLATALQDPANYFNGQPIFVQSGQLTNRSGSHKGRQDKSHFYGNSIDLGGAMIDGSRSDGDPQNLYPYDSAINQQLGRIIDEVGRLTGVATSNDPKTMERVDSLHGTPTLSRSHYHLNASARSATKHAKAAKDSLKGQLTFEATSPAIDLQAATISSDGRSFIHTYETFRSKTYGDAHPGGTLTIGYGATYYLEGTVITRNGQPVTIEGKNQKPQLGDEITQEEADRLSLGMIEQHYLAPVVSALKRKNMPATQSQLDALVSYSFHRGAGNAVKLIDRLHSLAQAGYANDELAVKAAFMHDINSVVAPRFRNGVSNRYLDTADMFIRGDYQRQHQSFDSSAWDTVIDAYLPD